MSFELLPPGLRSEAGFDAVFDGDPPDPARAPRRGAPARAGTAPDGGSARAGDVEEHREPRRAWYAHPVPWVAAAVAVAFAGSVALTSSLEDARPVDVTALAGGLQPLGDPPAPRWTVAVAPGAEIVPAVGAVVTADARLTAYAPDDGTVLWRSQVLGDRTTCVPGRGEPAREVVVCLASTGWRDQVARLTTVRSVTGEVLGERVVEIAGPSVASVGDADVVRAWWRDGEVVVVREDAATGEVRWEHTFAHSGVGRGGDVTVGVRRGVVDVLAPGIAATLTEDGRELADEEVWTIVQLHDGRYVGNQYGHGTATVFTAAGKPAFRVKGRVLEAALSDGSVPGVIVTNTFGAIVGVDAATGSRLWSAPGVGIRAVARVDGRVVVQTDSSYRSIDVRSGDEVWSVDLDGTGPWPVLTDGESLLVPEGGRGDGPGLVSIALDDGTLEWRWSLPADTFQVAAVEGRLFLLGADRLTAVS